MQEAFAEFLKTSGLTPPQLMEDLAPVNFVNRILATERGNDNNILGTRIRDTTVNITLRVHRNHHSPYKL